MPSPKLLRRVFACTALISVLSLLPAEAASFAARQPRKASFSAQLEHWGAVAWGFLAGLWEKRSSLVNPDGIVISVSSPSGDDSH